MIDEIAAELLEQYIRLIRDDKVHCVEFHKFPLQQTDGRKVISVVLDFGAFEEAKVTAE